MVSVIMVPIGLLFCSQRSVPKQETDLWRIHPMGLNVSLVKVGIQFHHDQLVMIPSEFVPRVHPAFGYLVTFLEIFLHDWTFHSLI